MVVSDTINQFINQMGYLEEKKLEGIIFYGSYQTGTNHSFSDVDLLIVFSSQKGRKEIKGYKTVSGIAFEYFERTLIKLYERADHDFVNGEDTLLNVIGYGSILLDNHGNLLKLKKYVIDLYQNPFPKMKQEDMVYEVVSLQKAMDRLFQFQKLNSPYFHAFYYLTLEKMRKYYHQLMGYSNFTTAKVYEWYRQDTISTIQHGKMPDHTFISLYLDCINSSEEQQMQYDHLQSLFMYVQNDFCFDCSNIRVDIGHRNH